jgi:hypothetical protein
LMPRRERSRRHWCVPGSTASKFLDSGA